MKGYNNFLGISTEARKGQPKQQVNLFERSEKSPSQGLTPRSECREYSCSLPSRKEEDESQGDLGGG